MLPGPRASAYTEGGLGIMVSFQSKFAHDIEKMREWRETLGYAVDSYDGYLVQFDRYCGAFFPDADILTWDIALSYLQTKREHCDAYVDVIAPEEPWQVSGPSGERSMRIPCGLFQL